MRKWQIAGEQFSKREPLSKKVCSSDDSPLVSSLLGSVFFDTEYRYFPKTHTEKYRKIPVLQKQNTGISVLNWIETLFRWAN